MEFKAVVRIIHARVGDVLFGMGPIPGNKLGNDSIRLPLNHPAYSAIYSLGMASLMNGRPLDVWISPSELNGETMYTIEWARLGT